MLNFLQSAGEGGKSGYHRHLNPPPSEAVSQFVISRKKAGDPEVREMLPFLWIPDLAMLRVARPE